MIKFSLITSHKPATLGKTFSLNPDGTLNKTTAGHMVRGDCEVVTLAGLDALVVFLPTIRTDQAITASLPRDGIQSARIVKKDDLSYYPDALTRSKDDLRLVRGEAGLLTLDYDPKAVALSRDELWGAACKVLPCLVEAGAVHWYSGSSLIFHGNDEKRGVSGQRIYVPVSDLSDLERVGKVLLWRSWLAGYGFVEISGDGKFLVRGLFDSSMFQIGKLDFIGGAVCYDGLEQRRGLPTILNQGCVLDTRREVPDLTPAENAEVERMIAEVKTEREAERKAVRTAWVAKNKPRVVKGLIERGALEDKANENADRILHSAIGGLLTGDFELHLETGEVLTVRDILAAPDKYDGMMCLDPLEPDYCGSKVVGHLNLTGGKPNLYSHAHGGATYRLENGDVRSYADWAKLIGDADGDPDLLVALGADIAADPLLKASARSKLKKLTAKAGGFSVATLDADIHAGDTLDEGGALVIRVAATNFAVTVDNALKALPSVPDIYERDGALVETVQHTLTGVVRVQHLNEVRLGYKIGQAAKWSSGDGYCMPSTQVLTAILAAGHWPGVRQLQQIVRAPMLALDGAIIDKPGYFPDQGILAVFDERDFPRCSLSAKECLSELRRLIQQTPFVTPIDEAAALAMLLTVASRATFDTAPAWLINAHDMSSGKTYLATIATALVGSGGIATWPGSEAERKKYLLSILLDGNQQCTIFDNVMSNVQSASMAAVLTAGREYSDRELGASKVPRVNACHSWIFTGNNIAPTKDLTRRIVSINLDTGMDTPALKEWSGNPLEEVRACPGHWQGLCLKILSDFILSGATPDLPPLASFATWSKVVRGALVWLGVPDPITAVTRNIEGDSDRDTLALLLACWAEAWGTEPVFLSEAIKEVGAGQGGDAWLGLHTLYAEIAGEREGRINPVTLGTWLGERKGRVVDGWRLCRADRRMTKGYAWWLEQVSKP